MLDSVFQAKYNIFIIMYLHKNSGADDGTRTRDLVLTKDALYQLSYVGQGLRRLAGEWSGRRESNPQPTAWKAVTLPLSYSRNILAHGLATLSRSSRPGPSGAGERTRTPDRLITNQMLYQLSYAGPNDLTP